MSKIISYRQLAKKLSTSGQNTIKIMRHSNILTNLLRLDDLEEIEDFLLNKSNKKGKSSLHLNRAYLIRNLIDSIKGEEL